MELASFFLLERGGDRARPLAWQNYDVIIYVQSSVWFEKIYILTGLARSSCIDIISTQDLLDIGSRSFRLENILFCSSIRLGVCSNSVTMPEYSYYFSMQILCKFSQQWGWQRCTVRRRCSNISYDTSTFFKQRVQQRQKMFAVFTSFGFLKRCM